MASKTSVAPEERKHCTYRLAKENNSKLSSPGKLGEDLDAWAAASKAEMDAFNRADSRCTYFEDIQGRLERMAIENMQFNSYDSFFNGISITRVSDLK